MIFWDQEITSIAS